MRSSWNFSTVIFEIWVLVLTKPGWANETPTTSLRVPGEYNYQNHHPVQHQHHNHHNQHHHQSHYHHNHEQQHYSVAGNTKYSSSRDSDSNHNHKEHHHHHSHPPYQNQPRSLASSYYSNGNNHQNHQHLYSAASSSSLYSSPHRCYVCLPPNKNSKEAQQILNIFAKELRPLIPDCSAFDPYVDTARFEFDCPPDYGGCLLRIHGSNISRACSRWRVNDCKKATSVEFCYCTTSLCNDKKPEPAVIPAVVHVSRNTDVRRRGSSGSSSNSRSRSSSSSSSQIGENSQGIRTRVSDDEDILSREDDEEEDDDDDNGGSGTGSPDQQLQTLIDPFTSTMDPTIILREETVVVAMEDPNPHTKIGISMTASTSSSGSSSNIMTTIRASCCSWSWGGPSSSSQGALSRYGSTAATNQGIFHLFVHLHRTMFVHLFAEQVVDDHDVDLDDHDDDDDDGNHYLSSNQQETGEKKLEAAETTASPFNLYSQLCFIVSLVVLNGLLS